MSGLAGAAIDILAFLVVITIVVVVHEGGHFVLAKLSGIRVDEFSVGFGPHIVSVRRGETAYSVRALPVGGYVRMAGMLGLEGEADAGERNFYRATIPRRLATVVAGVAVNFIFGAVCLIIVFAQTTPSSVPSGQPTARAGLTGGDVILRLGGAGIDNSSSSAISNDLHAATKRGQGRPMAVVYRSPDGSTHTATITPELVVYTNLSEGLLPAYLTGQALVISGVNGKPPGTGDPAAVLQASGVVLVSGFVEGQPQTRFSGIHLPGVADGDGSQTGDTAAWRIGFVAEVPGAAPLQAMGDGFGQVSSYVTQTVGVLGELFVHPTVASQQLSGPVGIATVAGATIQEGWVQFLFLIGLISVALGFINVLPIPFLDGGRILFILIEAVRRKRMDPRHEALAYAIGAAFVILAVVLITIGDIHRLSGGSP